MRKLIFVLSFLAICAVSNAQQLGGYLYLQNQASPPAPLTGTGLLYFDSNNNFNVTGSTGSLVPGVFSGISVNQTPTLGDIADFSEATAGIGTITVTSTGTTVSGTGTKFSRTFHVGDAIYANSETHTVATISSDTAMTTDAWTNAFGPGSYTTAGIQKVQLSGAGTFLFNSTSPSLGITSLIQDASTYSNTPYQGIRILPTITDTTGVSYSSVGALAQPTYVITTSPTATNIVGGQFQALIGSGNTQNLTGITSGLLGGITADAGSAGTLTSGYGVRSAVGASSSTMVLTSGYGFGVSTFGFTGSASITNGASFASVMPTGNITNYTGLLLGTVTIPSGNFGIYDSTGYPWHDGGSLSVASTVTVPEVDVTAGGPANNGSIYGLAGSGLALQMRTGTGNDFIIVTPNAASTFLSVPTGTRDAIWGSTTASTAYNNGGAQFKGGVGISGNLFSNGNSTFTGSITGNNLVSTVATGTAPLIVSSTTNVANLNASSVSGATYATGTWTPVANSFTNVGGAPTLSGTYSKIGNIVTICITITPVTSFTTVAGTSNVTGLPYPMLTTAGFYMVCPNPNTSGSQTGINGAFYGVSNSGSNQLTAGSGVTFTSPISGTASYITSTP